MTTAIAVLLVAAGSFVLRFAPLVVGSRYVDSARVQRVATHAGTAALAALVATTAAHNPGPGTAGAVPAAVASVIAAAIVARRGRPLHEVMGGGIAGYWVVLAVAGLV